jgi:uncharacterized protein involved in exopolysaccharide biosynthesis
MTEQLPFMEMVKKYRSRILLLVVSATGLALGISLLLPKEYMSQASVLPANSKMMDKQRVFGEHIQELYSAYGAGDDLDRLYATMRSATVLHPVADSFQLTEYYDFSGKKDAGARAYGKLLKQIDLEKTEFGEIRIRVWDKHADMSVNLANAIISRTQQVFDGMFTGYYDQSIRRMDAEIERKTALLEQLSDSSIPRRELAGEIAVMRNQVAQYRIAQLNPPPSLFVLEKPEPSTIADKPRIWLNTLAAFLVSLCTGLFWAAFFSGNPSRRGRNAL